MADRRPTVHDLRGLKGKRRLSMLRVETLEEAEAAERAGIELLSTEPDLLGPEFREAAPTVFVMAGLEPARHVTPDDYLRASFAAISAGGDAVYCAAATSTIRRLADEGIPVCGHTGLIPSRRTWTGGFRAVGRTAASARLVWDQAQALEAAGAFAAEIEVVPSAVAAAISERTSLFMISMGAGPGCDAQYLFSVDVLGENRGHVPRHARIYANFAAEYDRLQAARIDAYSAYAADVASGAYPEARHEVGIAEDELAAFLAGLPGR